MKRPFILLVLLLTAVVALLVAPAVAAPTVTIEFVNPPDGGLLTLAVGEMQTFQVNFTSDEQFISAMVLTNAYYPGRGVFWHGADIEVRATTASLFLTMTGKESTSSLLAVCDWPAAGDCWSAGTAPVAIAAGVRFANGVLVQQQFPFAVVVP